MDNEEQILIRLNVKHKTTTTTIEINVKDTVFHLKDNVEKAMKIKHEEQRLIFKGHVLKDEEIIEDTNVKNGDTIELFQQISIAIHIIEIEQAKEVKKNVVNSQMSAGGFGLMNKLGYASSGNSAIESMLESPFYKQMLESV